MSQPDGVTTGWIYVWSQTTGDVYGSAPVAAVTLDGEVGYVSRDEPV